MNPHVAQALDVGAASKFHTVFHSVALQVGIRKTYPSWNFGFFVATYGYGQ